MHVGKGKLRGVPLHEIGSVVDQAPPERWAGHAAEAEEGPVGRSDATRVQRVRSGLRQLLAAGHIGDREEVAASRFRNDYEFGVFGATDPERRGSGGDAGCYLSARIDARTRSRTTGTAARAAVPGDDRHPNGEQLLVAFVVEGLSLDGAARHLGLVSAGLPSWLPGATERTLQREHREARQRLSGAARRRLTGDLITSLQAIVEAYHEMDCARRSGRRRPAVAPPVQEAAHA